MKVLFVCSANICRSALCEAILKQKLKDTRVTGVEVESAGVHNYAGEPRDYTMVAYARKEGYELGGYAQCVTSPMLEAADWIICMEHFHLVEVQKHLTYAKWNRIHLFNEICFGEKTNLPDPTGDTGYMYAHTLHHIEEGCGILAQKIAKMMNDGQALP